MDEITAVEDIVRLAAQGFTDWGQFGHVTVRKDNDLLIFNYNAMAIYEAGWNFFERVSRGLIINWRTGEIVARGFDKFFNWGEGERTSTAPIVSVTEKIDGSLGVLYRTNGTYRIATRGSFDGEQADWATAFLQARFDLTGLPEELTLLFEIVYPENRVIIDYGDRQDLVLLAARNRFDGTMLSFTQVKKLAKRYGFSLPKVYTFDDIDALIDNTVALDADTEGYVVEFADGQRFKFKSLRYLELHKLVISLTFKKILQAVREGTIEQILAAVPDEFLDETRAWMNEIQSTVQQVKDEVRQVFETAPRDSRKDFALWVTANHKAMSGYLFAMLDGKDLEPLIYQRHDWGHDEEEETT